MKTDSHLNLTRRRFLALSASTAALGLFPNLTEARIIREMTGQVWVNNTAATLETSIKAGDTIKTGADSQISFVLGDDVYHLAARSTLRLRGYEEDRIVSTMRLISGVFMGVFGKTNKVIRVPAATIGIRGTGLFLKIEANSTYFCTCYGETQITTTGPTSHRQKISATHHEAYSITHDFDNPKISPDSMKYHQDEELFHLESLVGRKPPMTFKS